MKNLIICIFMSCPVSMLLAQDKHNIAVKFNINQITYNKMGSLNDYLLDTNSFEPMFYGKNQTNKIRKGVDYNLELTYQPFGFMDFGMYVNYQSSTIWKSLHLVYKPDPINYPDSVLYVIDGTNKIAANALSTGILTHLYISKILKFDQSKSGFIKRLQLCVGVKAGIGFSTLIDKSYTYDPTGTHNYKNYVYRATDIQGRGELNVGYKIGNAFFSEVGFNAGYQFFKTSQLKDRAGAYFYPYTAGGNTIRLDFSGFYYGVYIKIGK